MASLLGVEVIQFDRLRKSLGNPAEKKDGNKVLIHSPEWLRLWGAYTYAGKSSGAEIDEEVGGEWQEYKWKYQALREQLKYQQETGELIPEAEVRRGFSLVANQIRKAAEASCDACKDILEMSLDDAETQLDQAFDDRDSTEPQPGELSAQSDAGAD